MQRFIFLLTLLSFSTFASAQQALSLEDCIQYALKNNPTIKSAQLQIADADWRIKENLSTGLPQLTAGVTYTGFLQRAGVPASAAAVTRRNTAAPFHQRTPRPPVRLSLPSPRHAAVRASG